MEYSTGDVLEVNSHSFIPNVSFARHYGMYFLREGIPYVAHNSFSTGKIEIEPFDDFMKNRVVYRVINHVDLTDEEIDAKATELQETKDYKFYTYNCEDFVRELCQCNLGFDQRLGWLVALILKGIFIFLIVRWAIKSSTSK